ncbi:MAG: hypothetical protein ACHREM_18430 [Polyangiales bacterium]
MNDPPPAHAIIVCRACDAELTDALTRLVDTSKLSEGDGSPHVPAGYFVESDGSYFTRSAGAILVNIAGAKNTSPHPDVRRSQGCCGPDGGFGPNIVCACGAEVGTEYSDCWMAHALCFHVAAVLLRDV